jgi:hypothetical protein
MALQNVTGEYLSRSIFQNHPMGQNPFLGLTVDETIRVAQYGTDSNQIWQQPSDTTGEGFYITRGAKPVDQTCIEATSMDRYKPNMKQSFEMLWGMT